ncbi:MAG: 3-methyl-2-oxobutanoate hydroxymethyltransferase, partial [Desulfohalobiaceae bacterium]|nr:3-methyl-2-oxobutanoate hydroxymethyltransferase [Desulfohalobiaceae bacterium]
DTLSVGMEEMLHHTRAVANAAERALVVGDMPFLSYQTSREQAVYNAGRFLKEGRAQAIKLEGGHPVLPQIEAIVAAGIPVQGHLGLTPQSAAQLGGFKVQAKSAMTAEKLIEEAHALAQAGCFSIVLEAVPAEIGEKVAQEVPIPVLGIGAGAGCDGQVLVFHDLVGLFQGQGPKFAKQYVNLAEAIQEAASRFKTEVEEGAFPAAEHSFFLPQEERSKL